MIIESLCEYRIFKDCYYVQSNIIRRNSSSVPERNWNALNVIKGFKPFHTVAYRYTS
jgi:hypothetical protein